VARGCGRGLKEYVAFSSNNTEDQNSGIKTHMSLSRWNRPQGHFKKNDRLEPDHGMFPHLGFLLANLEMAASRCLIPTRTVWFNVRVIPLWLEARQQSLQGVSSQAVRRRLATNRVVQFRGSSGNC
jgi:hypothetical protein